MELRTRFSQLISLAPWGEADRPRRRGSLQRGRYLARSLVRVVGLGDRAADDEDRGAVVERLLHLTEGTVKEITAEAITIAHEAVPSLNWPPMTMSFKPPAKGVSAELKVGDHVSFSFAESEQGGFQIDSIVQLDDAPATESKP